MNDGPGHYRICFFIPKAIFACSILAGILFGSASMPFKDKEGKELPTCEISRVYREWKEQPAVRQVAIRADRLFEASRPPAADGVPAGIKFGIRDAVHNQFVLRPLLQRMAQNPHHPVPYVKELGAESLAQALYKLFLYL